MIERFNNWWIDRGRVVVAVLFLLLCGYIGYLTIQEQSTKNEIPVIQRIGSPCRSAFARGGIEAVRNDQQCTLQARLIYTNLCLHHSRLPDCAMILRGEVDVGSGNSSPSGQPSPATNGGAPGGSHGNSGSGDTGGGTSGGSGGNGGNGNGGNGGGSGGGGTTTPPPSNSLGDTITSAGNAAHGIVNNVNGIVCTDTRRLLGLC
jgi:hypothetical protein